MKNVLVMLLLSAFCCSLFAESNYTDQVLEQSAQAKKGGIAMVVFGVVMIGGGAAALSSLDLDAGTGYASGAIGGTLIAGGIALDVLGFLRLRESKQILKDAQEREGLPMALLVGPREVKLQFNF